MKHIRYLLLLVFCHLIVILLLIRQCDCSASETAIIQMHDDSEVNLNWKAIFVAMNLGEVDLNHVLRQQALKDVDSDNGSRTRLNMNFIRLTWYAPLRPQHSRRAHHPRRSQARELSFSNEELSSSLILVLPRRSRATIRRIFTETAK